MLAPGEVLRAPHLLDVEVTQVLRRLEGAGVLEPGRARTALGDLRALRLVRHPHGPLLGRVWELRHDLSAYDGLYIALAEALKVPLVTTERRQSGSPGHRARVKVP